jgi:heme biosynthesis-associated TPR repeat protein
MRAALWLIGLFGMAVAAALFAGSNQGTVTLFWAPYRLDLSLNLALAVIVLAFMLLYAALRALSALLQMPHQARRWRSQQKERAMHHSLLEALSHQQAGRFLRARKSALAALAMEESLAEAHAAVPHGTRLRAAAHMVAADASHALQDSPQRDHHWREVLANAPAQGNAPEQEMREGAQMRAARWALDDRDAPDALRRLAELPQGAARRTIALRIRLKASRLAGQTSTALDTARLLAKHRAFSPAAAASVVRGLVLESINEARDTTQLQHFWLSLDGEERAMPEIALPAASRLTAARLGTPAVPCRPAQRIPPAPPGAGAGALPGRPGRHLAGTHRGCVQRLPARSPLAVPGRHGLRAAPALGQGPATAAACGAPSPGKRIAHTRLAAPGPDGRAPGRCTRRRRSLEAGSAGRGRAAGGPLALLKTAQ